MALFNKERFPVFPFGKHETQTDPNLEIARIALTQKIRNIGQGRKDEVAIRTDFSKKYQEMVESVLIESGMDIASGGQFISEITRADGVKIQTLHFPNTKGNHWHFLEQRFFDGKSLQYTKTFVFGGKIKPPEPASNPFFAKRDQNKQSIEEELGYW